MQKYLTIGRQTPEKRPPEDRIRDFQEISKKFDPQIARQQASRCEQGGKPGCEVKCPLNNYILDWLRYATTDDIGEALIWSRYTNTFPEICGRICPQDRLCERNCILHINGEGAVTIGEIEHYIQEEAQKRNLIYSPRKLPLNGIKVAIVGSGPGGLTCADELNKFGYEVTVFEKDSHPGGLMMFGIPNFKLEKELIIKRIKEFEREGIQFKVNKSLGKEFDLEELYSQGYKAIFLAFGAYKTMSWNIANGNSHYVHQALPFLMETSKKNLKMPYEKEREIDLVGKNVVVLGGGDTAMDCVRTSVRKGARSVTCAYRRDRENMPGSQREVNHALEEGVKFEFLANPIRLKEKKDHSVITLRRMKLGERDRTGRQSVEKTHKTFTLNADIIFVAFGFKVKRYEVLEEMGVKTGRDGRIITNSRGETTLSGVFAGGDCVRGPSLVPWAIRDGRDISKSIHQYLSQKLEIKKLLEGININK